MRKVQRAVRLLVVLITCCAGHAYATGLLGDSVTSQYYAYGGLFNGFGSPATFTANGTVQDTFCAVCSLGFNLTVTNTQVDYVLTGPGGTWSPSVNSLNSGGLSIANGNLLTFTGGSTITGVTLDESSTMTTFLAADITFNGNNIAIDWAGLVGATGQTVILDVTTSGGVGAVPEPATIGLMGFGLSLGGLLLRRRAKRV